MFENVVFHELENSLRIQINGLGNLAGSLGVPRKPTWRWNLIIKEANNLKKEAKKVCFFALIPSVFIQCPVTLLVILIFQGETRNHRFVVLPSSVNTDNTDTTNTTDYRQYRYTDIQIYRWKFPYVWSFGLVLFLKSYLTDYQFLLSGPTSNNISFSLAVLNAFLNSTRIQHEQISGSDPTVVLRVRSKFESNLSRRQVSVPIYTKIVIEHWTTEKVYYFSFSSFLSFPGKKYKLFPLIYY